MHVSLTYSLSIYFMTSFNVFSCFLSVVKTLRRIRASRDISRAGMGGLQISQDNFLGGLNIHLWKTINECIK